MNMYLLTLIWINHIILLSRQTDNGTLLIKIRECTIIGGMAMKLFIKYISIVLAIYLLSLVLNTIYIGSFGSLFIMGMVLLLVNLIIKPILMLITLPANLLTLGLFSFIVNAWTIMIADSLVGNISMGGFLNSLIAAFVITILNNLFQDKD